ncbi:hypothetical protein [Poseidonibacter ostreae]|uniref:Uncharacterized protein n=1 Tax=Poseidonibacter ostreae TaxID=2654171 RepID=A0A6L4WWK4_9BACT|nr:hypothetical protein [Poseidonibacter ostreae]KAB7891318.1 hypothetical protein GBG19_00345 [Poseidonibacter ostreae]
MTKYNKDFLGTKKLLASIVEVKDEVKDKYYDFYLKNIGNIDKLAQNSLEDYVLEQHRNPLGNCTIRLEKDKYVMQKELDNGEYFYLPFEKNKSPQIPYKDAEKMEMLFNEYPKHKPLRKKALLDRIYEKNKSLLLENKMTKKHYYGSKIGDLIPELEKLGIADLTEAMSFYDVVEKRTSRAKTSKAEEVMCESAFFDKFNNYKERIADCDTHEVLKLFSDLEKEVASHISSFDSEVLKRDSIIKETVSEDISCISIPSSEYMLDAFFDKDIDRKAIKFDIYRGKLEDMEMKISFKFYSPCENLTEVVDRFETLDYVMSNTQMQEFEQEETITLK